VTLAYAAEAATGYAATAHDRIAQMAAARPPGNVMGTGPAHPAGGIGHQSPLIIDAVAPLIAAGGQRQGNGGKKGKLNFP
jgi:hypothetical protein